MQLPMLARVLTVCGVQLAVLSGIGSCTTPPTSAADVSKTELRDTVVPTKDQKPDIIAEFEFYRSQIGTNYPLVFEHIRKHAQFDTINAAGRVLTYTEYQKYVVALITQESNFIQRRFDGSLLKSHANAVGVAQFTHEGVKAINNYLAQKSDTLGKKPPKLDTAKRYRQLANFDLTLLSDTSLAGIHEGYRAACLLSKIQLLRHPDSWKFAAVEYNSGRSRRGNYDHIKRRLPRETQDYVKNMAEHMSHFEKGDYLRYLILRWGVVLIELENMYGNRALKEANLPEAVQRFDRVIQLNNHLISNKLDTVMRYHTTIILHANFELGNLHLQSGDSAKSLDYFSEVLKTKEKDKRYEYRSARLTVGRLKTLSSDSVVRLRAQQLMKDYGL